MFELSKLIVVRAPSVLLVMARRWPGQTTFFAQSVARWLDEIFAARAQTINNSGSNNR